MRRSTRTAARVALGACAASLFVGARGRLSILRVLAAESTRACWRWALAAVVALDLWSVERTYWIFSPPARACCTRSDPAIEYLKKQPSRAACSRSRWRRTASRRAIPSYGGDALMVHRVRLRRSATTATRSAATSELASRSEQATTATRSTRLLAAHERPLSLHERRQSPISALQEARRARSRNAAGSTVYLYRLPGDNPPAWVAPAIVKAGDEADARHRARSAVRSAARRRVRLHVERRRASRCTRSPSRSAITARVTRYDAGPHRARARAHRRRRARRSWCRRTIIRAGRRPSTDAAAIPAIARTTPSSAFRSRPGARQSSLDFHEPAYRDGQDRSPSSAIAARARGAGRRRPASTGDVSSEPDALSARSSSSRPTTSGRTSAGSSSPSSRRTAASRCWSSTTARRTARAQIVDEIAAADPRVHAARSGRRRWGSAPPTSPASAGRSSATTTYVFEMDADFSHDPGAPPAVPARHRGRRPRARLALPAGRVTVVNWPIGRLILSYAANIYARAVTGLACVGRDRRLQVLSQGGARGDRLSTTCGRTATPSRSR